MGLMYQRIPGYLYNIRGGELVVEKGNALISGGGFHMFEIDASRKRISINRKPWVVHNNFIWVPEGERDDLKAVKIFIAHETLQVDKYEVMYLKHTHKLKDLRNLYNEMSKHEIK